MEARQRQEEQIRKRVACEERAFHVVLRLLDNPITEDYLRDAGQFITPSHYADVVEERSIAKMCGYPPCGNNLGSVPQQRYRISTKSNTVYDITERKEKKTISKKTQIFLQDILKFCSNFCFKSSQFFEKQIATSPVWSREKEPKVNFEFLRVSAKSCSAGDKVVLNLPRTEVKEQVKQLAKLDSGTNSTEKHTSQRENSCEKNDASCDIDNKPSLVSDIVDHMAEVKASYTGETEGIKVDFSEEKVSGETALDGPTVQTRGDSDQLTDEFAKMTVSGETTQELVGVRKVTLKSEGIDHRYTSEHATELETSIVKERDCDVVKTSKTVSGKILETNGNIRARKEDLPEVSRASLTKSVFETSTQTPDSVKGQLPGESKEDYVMRLLNRKKHLLGQLADIQQTEEMDSKSGNKESSTGKNCFQTEILDSDEEVEDFASTGLTGGSPEGRTASSKAVVLEYKDVSKSKNLHQTIESAKPPIQEIIPQEQITAVPPSKENSVMSPKSSPTVKLQPLNAVAKVLEEWITRDSLRYLGIGGNDDSVTLPQDFEKNYAELCQQISKEEKNFENLLGEESMNDSAKSAHCPVPDYKKLQEEAKNCELRVREFYKGSTCGLGKNVIDKTGKDTMRAVTLPTVDSHDQMMIRRKIVLERLDKVIPDLLVPLRLSIRDVSHLVRELVYTFSFTSQNILFKPGEWTLAGILLMKMLGLKSKKIEKSFKEVTSVKYFKVILAGIGHKTDDLDSIVHSMVDVAS